MYHGRLSSASTGRSATIRLPLAATLSELNWMFWCVEAAASTSMSSSKSDMLLDDLCALESRDSAESNCQNPSIELTNGNASRLPNA